MYDHQMTSVIFHDQLIYITFSNFSKRFLNKFPKQLLSLFFDRLKGKLILNSIHSLNFASTNYNMLDINWQTVWRKADAVCFDVDSTVITSEGIDELANFCGVGKEVAELTAKAMGEGAPFRESLHRRLSLIKPSKDLLDSFINEKPFELSPGIEDLIKALKDRRADIYLVSGGFRSIIQPIADYLNIPDKNVFANQMKFDASGDYIGFDENEPTSSSGGKRVVIGNLIQGHNYQNIVMIGDGVTDLEAYPPAHLFIGYGGNKLRENVRMLAPHYVTDFKELIDALG